MPFSTVFWSNLRISSNFEPKNREKFKQLLRLRSFSGCLYKKKCTYSLCWLCCFAWRVNEFPISWPLFPLPLFLFRIFVVFSLILVLSCDFLDMYNSARYSTINPKQLHVTKWTKLPSTDDGNWHHFHSLWSNIKLLALTPSYICRYHDISHISS